MKKLTITSLSKELNMSYNGTVKKVKKLVQDKKLKEKIKLTEELNDKGRMVKTVVISDDLYKKLKKEHAKNSEPIELSEIHENKPIQSEIEQKKEPVSSEVIQKLVNELIDSKNQLINYAEQVGQVRLLTDNLITKENDAKYWQEKYFELKYELDKIKAQNINEKEKRNNKKWWQIKII